ncbi:hypothetical protein BCV71DRAFT_232747 [Rhizopus microsporus]|uniref:Uncharacterized protein n=1 Tax=Rhizopus microsporus TaxID=58291 RepID=A0A1X0S9I8_RHIZD|nr:hypothetical protein BCV71DRAFT_232747 [Rhizopus microsporus]
MSSTDYRKRTSSLFRMGPLLSCEHRIVNRIYRVAFQSRLSPWDNRKQYGLDFGKQDLMDRSGCGVQMRGSIQRDLLPDVKADQGLRRETDKGKKIVLSKPYFGKVINEIDYDDVTVAVEAFITFGDRKCLYGLRYSLARLVNLAKIPIRHKVADSADLPSIDYCTSTDVVD